MGKPTLQLLNVAIKRAGCNYSIFSCWAAISLLNLEHESCSPWQGKGDLARVAQAGFYFKFITIYGVQ